MAFPLLYTVFLWIKLCYQTIQSHNVEDHSMNHFAFSVNDTIIILSEAGWVMVIFSDFSGPMFTIIHADCHNKHFLQMGTKNVIIFICSPFGEKCPRSNTVTQRTSSCRSLMRNCIVAFHWTSDVAGTTFVRFFCAPIVTSQNTPHLPNKTDTEPIINKIIL